MRVIVTAADDKEYSYYCGDDPTNVQVHASGALMLARPIDLDTGGMNVIEHIYAPGQWKEVSLDYSE